MGWLFGKKKKVPQVPASEGIISERALRFPVKRSSSERIIEPDEVKEAVGFEMPNDFSEEAEMPATEVPTSPLPPRTGVSPFFKPQNKEDLFVKVEVYQRVLGEIDMLKRNLAELSETNKNLELSEYNEENNFNRLRRSMKLMHDSLLQIDKTVFKFQGD
ncbi:MAG: hypothetical protein ABH824_02485 [Nanoarchaeota archaeon]|nr:hypothetical protein [Nanoarchaeota archaeon]MBU1632448.1 hypothetical protein [Nanoarchaeota archaeon]MBU1876334.1 hypothetical protein [Nanoarchaeota archaeon]